ncbi:MAG: preprotein translocase subunit SecD [Marmoricola sp.]|nr:preprotein translocase subunit SecD [Marmoricola sp.]
MNRVRAALVVVLALTACSNAGAEKPAAAPATTPSTASPAGGHYYGSATIELREVIASDEAGGVHQPEFKAFRCPGTGPTTPHWSTSDFACDSTGHKYRLRAPDWEGRAATAEAHPSGYGAGWVVDITLGTSGASAFSRISRKLYLSRGRLAILIGGRVFSAPGFEGVITTGELEIVGFDEAAAQALARQLG